jgi:sigma-E factor negative regulatory protein RseC
MDQILTVIRLEGDQAVLHGERASSCGSCAGKSSCSTLGSWKQRTIELRVPNEIGAAVGDEVVVRMPDGLLLKIAWRLYGMPMAVFFFAGLFLYQFATAQGAANPDLWAVLGGLAAMGATYFSIWRRSRRDSQPLDLRMVDIHARAVR